MTRSITCGVVLSYLLATAASVRAEPSAPAQAASVVIERTAVFDPGSGKMLPDRTIVIRGERIIAVTPTDAPAAAAEIPAGALRIDGQGRFAVAGLIDAHVHLVHVLDLAGIPGDQVLPLYLAAGVTSVRSAGDEMAAATRVAEAAAANPDRSPRVFTCSPLLDGNPPVHRGAGRAINNPGEVPAILDEVKARGATTVKIYAGTARPVGRAIIVEAHRRDLRVIAHLGAYSAQDAVADGIDGLEHIWSVFNYVIPPGPATQRGRVDLSNPLCESLVSELANRKVFVDPTLVVFRNMILLPDVPAVVDHSDNLLAPPRLREFWPVYLRQSGCPQGGPLEDRRREFAKFQELTVKLHRAGVPLLVGTDSPEPNVTPGFALHQELEILVEAGLSPADALTAATLTNATALRQQDHLGSIAAGKMADLVLLSANPLDDIHNTRKIEWVVRGGRARRPSEVLLASPK
jgi:imidazolonepropionase-like amidohydrolase